MSNLVCLWDAKACLGEGVVWVPRDQAIYWVDIKESSLFRYFPASAAKQSWSMPNMISSLVPTAEGQGFIATFSDGVFYLDAQLNKLQKIVDPEADLPANRMNDGCCDQSGNYWFGSMDDGETQASGSFYCLDQFGQCHSIIGDIPITNGPTFSQDGLYIYLTDTLKRTVYRAKILQDHQIEALETFVIFKEDEGFPDGMCVDQEGYVWIAHWGAFRITRFKPDGRVDRIVELPVPHVSKCVFGGDELNTLFITTARHGLSKAQLDQYPQSGGLFSVDVGIKGFEVSAYSGKVA